MNKGAQKDNSKNQNKRQNKGQNQNQVRGKSEDPSQQEISLSKAQIISASPIMEQEDDPWAGLAEVVLDYYDQHKRQLPWREDPSPYHVWISEIMLQQTRVDTVIGYYQRFISRFPTIAQLAQGEADSLLKLWEGLGYYSRIRNIHKAAKVMVENHQGQLPRSKQELLTLPGIGDYTAGAIASIAFGQKETAIDGNLIRVGSRLIGYGQSTKNAQGKKAMEALWQQLVPRSRPGDFNQAMMDIGATLCRHDIEPLCNQCPLSAYCKGYKQGNPWDFPIKEKKKPAKKENKTLFILWRQGEVLLERREDKGLLGGMLQLPMAEGHLDEEEAMQWLKNQGLQGLKIEKGPTAKHLFSHKVWEMIAWEIQLDPFVVSEQPTNRQWVHGTQIDDITLPTAFLPYRKRIRGIAKGEQ